MIIYSTVRFSSSAKITICLILFLSSTSQAVVCGEARHPGGGCLLPGTALDRTRVSWRSPPSTQILCDQGHRVKGGALPSSCSLLSALRSSTVSLHTCTVSIQLKPQCTSTALPQASCLPQLSVLAASCLHGAPSIVLTVLVTCTAAFLYLNCPVSDCVFLAKTMLRFLESTFWS